MFSNLVEVNCSLKAREEQAASSFENTQAA